MMGIKFGNIFSTNKIRFDEKHYEDLDIDKPNDGDLLNVQEYLYRSKWIHSLLKSGSILDLGCNNGILSLGYAYWGRRVVGIDLSRKAVDFCNNFLSRNHLSNSIYLQGRIEDLKSNEKFDNIFLCEVIEHVENPEKVLKTAEKHLNFNGTIFLTTPEWNGPYGINNTGDDAKEHLRIYKEKELKKLIEKRGSIIDFQTRQLIYCAYSLK